MFKLVEALIHKVDGPYVGAYEYKDDDETQGVQPVTIHKNNIKDHYDRLLNSLPVTFKGKKPIGSIGPDYRDSRDVRPITEAEDPDDDDFEEEPPIRTRLAGTVKQRVSRAKKPARMPKPIAGEDEVIGLQHPKLSKFTLPAGLRVPPTTTPKDMEKIIDDFKSPEHVDEVFAAYPNIVNQIKNKFKTDSNGLKTLVAVSHQASNQWGPHWAHRLVKDLQEIPEPEVKKPEPEPVKAVPKEKPIKQPVKPQAPVVTPSKATNAPVISKTIEHPAITGSSLGQFLYQSSTGRHVADMDYLAHALPLTINMNIDKLKDENPDLAAQLHDKLGEHWKEFLKLARSAKTATALGQDRNAWKSSLRTNPLITNTGLSHLGNLNDVVNSIHTAAKAAPTVTTTPPLPPEEDKAHYHAQGQRYEFKPEELNKAMALIGNTPAHSIIYSDPELYKKLKSSFGPNWATLLAVGQRINKLRVQGEEDPLGRTKQEYADVLNDTFGPDWEQNFKKVTDALDDSSAITQADPSIAKKDQQVDQLQPNYTYKETQFSPDLKYLKDFALPGFSNKSEGYLIMLSEKNPDLAQELQKKLGPSWYTIMGIAREATKYADKEENPYEKTIEQIEKNKIFKNKLEDSLGPNYLSTVTDVINAAINVPPPPELKDALAQAENPQAPDPNAPEQPQQAQPPEGQQPPEQEVPQGAPQQQETPPQGQEPTAPPEGQTAPEGQAQEPPAGAEQQPPQQPAQAQPAAPEQPQAAPEPPEIPMPSPIEPDGETPQAKKDEPIEEPESGVDTTIKSELPVPPANELIGKDIVFIGKKGRKSVIPLAGILQAMQFSFTKEDEDSKPEVRQQLRDTLGEHWRTLNQAIELTKFAIEKNTDPYKYVYGSLEARPRIKRNAERDIGPDLKLVLDSVIHNVAYALTQPQQTGQ